ncbi:MAG: hypothetical protein K6G20_09995 [Ruminococcus sp.]|nr:hypothetical protein [Ruminococcus sp.]
MKRYTCTEKDVPLTSTSKKIHVSELQPGQSAVIDLTISDMWKSPLQKYHENSKLFIDALSLGIDDPVGGFIAGFASRFIEGTAVQKDRITLYYFKDLTYAQIGEKYGVSHWAIT